MAKLTKEDLKKLDGKTCYCCYLHECNPFKNPDEANWKEMVWNTEEFIDWAYNGEFEAMFTWHTLMITAIGNDGCGMSFLDFGGEDEIRVVCFDKNSFNELKK